MQMNNEYRKRIGIKMMFFIENVGIQNMILV